MSEASNRLILDPEGPHSPDYTYEVANHIAEAARVLAYATRGGAGLEYPSDVAAVLGTLSQASSRLAQTLQQLARFITTEHEGGRIVEWEGGPCGGDTDLAVTNTRAMLLFANETATELARNIDSAHNSVTGLKTP